MPPVSTVHWAFFEHENGTIWTGTGDGFYRLSPGEEAPMHHYLTTSASHPANFVRSFLRSRDGALLVGTSGWVYRSASLAGPSSPSPVVVTRAEVSSRTGTRRLSPFALVHLHLAPGDDNFTLEFAALDYHTAQALRYRYRLDGFDWDWVEADHRRFATYTNVPPGRYVFRAEVLNEGYATPLVLPVRIVPAFWQTAWFRALVVLLLLGLGVAAYHWRVQCLLEVERLRMRIASDLHDDFSSDLSGIALATALVERRAGLSERDHRQLLEVRKKALHMIERLRDVVWYVNPEHDHLPELALRMRHVATTLLPDATVTFDFPPSFSGTLPMAARRDLFLIYKEALHDVARHAGARHVSVRLVPLGKRLLLEIRDDGKGFAPDAVIPGHGLKSMQLRAAQMQATFEAWGTMSRSRDTLRSRT